MSMWTSFRRSARAALVAALGRLTERHAVLLPREAADEEAILEVRGPYRVAGPMLVLEILEPGPGRLTA